MALLASNHDRLDGKPGKPGLNGAPGAVGPVGFSGGCNVRTFGGSAAAGELCQFPFLDSGRRYYGCTTAGKTAPWCRTRSGKWGYCALDGLMFVEASFNLSVPVVGGNAAGPQETCAFPFQYQGKMWSSCIPDGFDAGWCFSYIQKTPNEVSRWGYCAMESFGGMSSPVDRCRSKCMKASGKKTQPWCYVDDERKRWGYCKFSVACRSV